MRSALPMAFAAACILASAPVWASLQLTSSAFKNNTPFPTKYAYCKPDAKTGEVQLSDDISPPLAWSGAPKGTKSYVVILSDPDIPNVPYFDIPGHVIQKNAPRVTGYHWILVDVPATMTSLPEGAGSKGFVPGGKKPGMTPYGLMGINVYTKAFQAPIGKTVDFDGDKDKGGTYGRYDGPCAPWNDLLVHQYTFTVYALDVPSLNLPKTGDFTGEDALKAMKGHVLEKATLIGDYTTNPQVMKKQ